MQKIFALRLTLIVFLITGLTNAISQDFEDQEPQLSWSDEINVGDSYSWTVKNLERIEVTPQYLFTDQATNTSSTSQTTQTTTQTTTETTSTQETSTTFVTSTTTTVETSQTTTISETVSDVTETVTATGITIGFNAYEHVTKGSEIEITVLQDPHLLFFDSDEDITKYFEYRVDGNITGELGFIFIYLLFPNHAVFPNGTEMNHFDILIQEEDDESLSIQNGRFVVSEMDEEFILEAEWDYSSGVLITWLDNGAFGAKAEIVLNSGFNLQLEDDPGLPVPLDPQIWLFTMFFVAAIYSRVRNLKRK